METATSRLRDEHQVILRVAAALEALLDTAERGSWNYDAIEDCVAFIRLFADACHHGKEEDLLFPALAERGMPRQHGPIAVMLQEHEQGRAYARHMAGALPRARDGDAAAQATLKNAGRGYVGLIRGHIMKEDNVLFEMADQMVAGPGCQSLCTAYAAVCARRYEGRTKAELETLAASIEQRAS